MKYTITWTHEAENNLNHIFAFIANDDPEAAWRVITTIKKSVENLETFPYLGKAGRRENTRELKVGKFPTYFVVYEVEEAEVFITSVFRYSQNYT